MINQNSPEYISSRINIITSDISQSTSIAQFDEYIAEIKALMIEFSEHQELTDSCQEVLNCLVELRNSFVERDIAKVQAESSQAELAVMQQALGKKSSFDA